MFGFDLHRVWFERCIRPFAEGPLAAYNVQSVDGFLARLMTSGGRQDFSPLAVGPAFHAARLVLLALLIGTVVAVCSARAPGPGEATLDLAITLALALVVSPISWTGWVRLRALSVVSALSGET